jgi:DNA-directed RNA polymerase specialized sigma24 family protein
MRTGTSVQRGTEWSITLNQRERQDARDQLRALLHDPDIRLRGRIKLLSWRQLAILVMLRWTELSQGEIADELGLSRTTVYSDLCAVLETLQTD